MFKKIKKTIFTAKVLIIVLVVLVVVGWGFTIYFAVRANKGSNIYCTQSMERLEKLNSYAVLLDNSRKLINQGRGLESLEMDIHFIGNGSLLAEWEDVVFGGNQEQDIQAYYDIIIDSLKFFSK